MAKHKRPIESVSGRYAAFPHAVMDSEAFRGANHATQVLLLELMRQHTGENNGRLHLATGWLRKRGWKSVGTIQRAKIELIERGLIVQTRQGGLNSGASWFALTWLPISNFAGLDITAKDYHPGAWCLMDKPLVKEKRDACSDGRSSAVPVIGAVNNHTVPTIGTKTTLSGEVAVPTIGNNEYYQLPQETIPEVLKGAGR